MRRSGRNRWLTVAALSVMAAGVGMAQTVVPAGATLALNGGTFDSAGTSIQLDGQLTLGAGQLLGVNDFIVSGGATASLDSGQLTVGGNWENHGSVAAGNSVVEFIDGGHAASALLGATTFASVDFTSANGKHYLFDSGLTQTVTTALDIHGTPTAPIQFDVTTPGNVAFLDLLAGGSQNINDVGVSDIHATGQHLAPNLHNEGGRGNDDGWFAVGGGGTGPVATPVPATSTWLTALLALLLAGAAALASRHSSEHASLNQYQGTTP